MNIIVFDTETISLEKQFIYNLGWVVVDTETGEVKNQTDLVISQIWNNKPLMTTSYYANKRPLYTAKMKARKTKQVNWGTACRLMKKVLKEYNITDGFAYNAPFDIKAFYFNHLFYRNKTRPLDGIKVHDIMNYLEPIADTLAYKNFCKVNGFMTKNGRTKKTAESVYAFLTQNADYKEEHTALEDSKIETAILLECLKLGEFDLA